MFTKLSKSVLNLIDERIDQNVLDRIEMLRDSCNSWGFNDWGYSVDWIKRACGIGVWLYRNYFRVETHGIENIPEGRVMLIGNHSSQMAYDGVIITTALFLELNPPRFVHAMIGNFFADLPIYAEVMPRLGQVIGTPENCTRLLKENKSVLVFPEGQEGGGKIIFDRYRLKKFGQGFMQIALETRSPIVPFGFIGGEEMVPSFSRLTPIAKLFGTPYIPLSPTWIFPLPTKCHIYFGKPFVFNDDPLDDESVEKNVEMVKSEVRNLVEKGLEKRKSIF